MSKNISVPDIGDFKDVEIIEVLVKPGDKIKKNDPIVTLESDKSSVEVPSPYEGKISQLKVKIGDKVSEGSILATLEAGNENKEETIKPTKEIKKVKQATSSSSPPERAFEPVKDRTSGGKKLNVNCSYCSHKQTCWEDVGLITKFRSGRPVFLVDTGESNNVNTF